MFLFCIAIKPLQFLEHKDITSGDEEYFWISHMLFDNLHIIHNVKSWETYYLKNKASREEKGTNTGVAKARIATATVY